MAAYTGGVLQDPGGVGTGIIIGQVPRISGISIGNLGPTAITDNNNNQVSTQFNDGKVTGQLWPRY
jgi:hypothetical protein